MKHIRLINDADLFGGRCWSVQRCDHDESYQLRRSRSRLSPFRLRPTWTGTVRRASRPPTIINLVANLATSTIIQIDGEIGTKLMTVPIVYVETFPGPASADGDGASLALFADNGTNQHQTILATVGGLMTVHIIATGAGLTSGQYNNIPIISTSNNWRSGCNSKHQRERRRIYPLDSGSGGHSRLRLYAQFLWRESCNDRYWGQYACDVGYYGYTAVYGAIPGRHSVR